MEVYFFHFSLFFLGFVFSLLRVIEELAPVDHLGDLTGNGSMAIEHNPSAVSLLQSLSYIGDLVLDRHVQSYYINTSIGSRPFRDVYIKISSAE